MGFGHRGRFCRRYGVTNTTADACALVEANIPYVQEDSQGNLYDGNIYWEPVNANDDTDWSNWAGTQTTDTGIEANLYARYTIPSGVNGLRVPRDYRTNFRVKTRELRPDATNPMEGSDVAMLEAVLWQLGISPQHQYPGTEGTRLGEHSPSLGGPVGGTAGIAGRAIFGSGMAGGGAGSLERMVRRFQGRNDTTCEPCSSQYAGNTSSGAIGNNELGDLLNVWQEYYAAYLSHSGQTTISFSSANMNAWLINATNLWETGAGANNSVPPTYTQAQHAAMLAAAGQTGGANFTREELLRDWKSQEAANHWGVGFPATHYRITEGGDDEYGSIGFSQIKYAYRYGDNAMRCTALNNYNLYDPAQAIAGMIAFVSAAPGSGNSNCGRSFYKAFSSNGNWRTIQANNPDLVGYLDVQGNVLPIAQNRVDDAYELLMKSLGGYNGQTGTGRTWANMLTTHHTMQMAQTYSNRTYAIQIMRRYGIPARTYVWVGARFDYVRDASGVVIPDANGQPVPHPNAGQPEWCFAYGENEWMTGNNWTDVQLAAVGSILRPPVGRIACQ